MSDKGAAVQVRLDDKDLRAVENWRRNQNRIPPRSEALRQLIRKALRDAAAQVAAA